MNLANKKYIHIQTYIRAKKRNGRHKNTHPDCVRDGKYEYACEWFYGGFTHILYKVFHTYKR